jgi:tetratricopeptide (TPR) repeat protein
MRSFENKSSLLEMTTEPLMLGMVTRSQSSEIESLMKAPLATMSDAEAIDSVATLIDISNDACSEDGITRAFGQLKEIGKRHLSPADQALLLYFEANAWGSKRRISAAIKRQWDNADLQGQILALYKARSHDGFNSLDQIRRCQILTNLGILFNEVGRFIEAIELWDSALDIIPNFAMAHGSRGSGFKYYGLASEDRYDQEILMLTAHDSFVAATAKGVLWDSIYPPAVKADFKVRAEEIAERFDLGAIANDLDLDGPSLGRSTLEQSYRRWCLKHRLFVNPLNDLGSHPVAACDYLLLPSLTVGLETRGMPSIVGLYSQMKQEYAFARLMLYEGQPSDTVHFADRRVRLSNTLDYPSFTIATEKVRTSFRLAYSILGKIGFFVNIYWQLGMDASEVNFQTVWYDKVDRKRVLRDKFKEYQNWPLQGLYWQSKDLEEQFQPFLQYDAAETVKIRNHLEHKYLQVREGWVSEASIDPVAGSIGHSISDSDLAAKALRLMKTARAAMIYLPLAVHAEERAKGKASKAFLVGSSLITTLPDNRKR